MTYLSWTAYYKKHSGKFIDSEKVIRWTQSWLSWLNAVPLGRFNSAALPKLHLNCITSGIPHRTLEDDVYRGMFIPKGSLVIANTR